MTPESLHSDTEASLLLASLKEMLKARKIGYQSIADSLNVSLPTVKRMLNKSNLPLDRFYALCKIAEVDPADVFEHAKKHKPKHTVITAAQDELFSTQPETLSYFHELVEAGKNPQQIADENGLSQVSTERYLSRLEKVGLIEREVGNKVRILVSPPIGFGPDSKVMKASAAAFLEKTVNQVLSPDCPKGAFSILKPLRLHRQLYQDMIGELTEVVDKYAFLSEHSGNREIPDREDWSLVIASGPGSNEDLAPIVNC